MDIVNDIINISKNATFQKHFEIYNTFVQNEPFISKALEQDHEKKYDLAFAVLSAFISLQKIQSFEDLYNLVVDRCGVHRSLVLCGFNKENITKEYNKQPLIAKQNSRFLSTKFLTTVLLLMRVYSTYNVVQNNDPSVCIISNRDVENVTKFE